MDSVALRAEFMRIDDFSGEFSYLHPDHICEIHFNGIRLQSVTQGIQFLRYSHALNGEQYNYGDSVDPPENLVSYLAEIDGTELLKNGTENPHWSENRHKWVEILLREKYRRNIPLRKKLSHTGDRNIIYKSEDHFLGSDGRHGQNCIGRLTEQIRKDIAEHKDHLVWLFMCQDISKDNFWITLDEMKDGAHVVRHAFEGKCCYDIGRVPSCDLRPSNPSISRVHATLCMKKNGGIFVITYNDVTGVTVGGRYVKANEFYPLRNGDQLTIGASTRVYRVKIDADLVRKKREAMMAKKLELQKRAEIKAKQVQTELDMFLNGSEEVGRMFRLSQSIQVVVVNLSYKTKRADIYDFFSSCGDIEYVNMPQGKGLQDDPTSDTTSAVRGIAFVKFKNKKGAANALDRDGMYLNYRKVRVQYKTKQTWRDQQERGTNRSRSPSRSRQYRARRDHYRSSSNAGRRSYRHRSPSRSSRGSSRASNNSSGKSYS